MRLEQRFRLAPGPATVWETLGDSRLAVSCLPGAELDKMIDPDHLEGRLTVRLGPIVARFDGSVAIERDEAARSGIMRARGIDKRTRTRVRADIYYTLASADDGTELTLVSEVALMGTLAQFARQTLIEKVADGLTRDFAAALEARLADRASL